MLNLKYNELKRFDFNVFAPAMQSVEVHLQSDVIEELDISCSQSMCHFKDFNTNDFFENLKSLHAFRSKHENITKLLEKIGENLETLDLSWNFIGKIDNHTLKRFRNLRHLKMSHSNITNISSGAFINQTRSLISLDLSYNNLTDVDSTALSHAFPYLQTLNLEGNQLTKVNRITPDNFKNLSSLAISQNHFSCVYLKEFFGNWPNNLKVASKLPKGEINIRGVNCAVDATRTNESQSDANVIMNFHYNFSQYFNVSSVISPQVNINRQNNSNTDSTWLFVGIAVVLAIVLVGVPAIIWFFYEKLHLSKYKVRNTDKRISIENIYEDQEDFENIPLSATSTIRRPIILNMPLPQTPIEY